MIFSYAQLTADQLKEIRRLEGELEVTLVAFQGHDIALADVPAAKLARIQQEEARLGLTLVAVKG